MDDENLKVSMDDFYVVMNALNFLWSLYYVCDRLYVIVFGYIIIYIYIN
jgi:hypothetical protein